MSVLEKRHKHSSLSLGTASGKRQGNLYHSTTYCYGSRWPYRGAMQLQYWAPPPLSKSDPIFIRKATFQFALASTLSVLLNNYIFLLLARCSRTFISTAVLPSIACFEVINFFLLQHTCIVLIMCSFFPFVASTSINAWILHTQKEQKTKHQKN